ncbi:FAD-dependent monooxygenase [Sphingobium sp.]|uniref:FAD-dependent monooxygenase n=1 Tax=Sphingobium sp. TaxID=1912891 RepID=UPI0028BD74DD|nr:FAD-dependent monooxygenase [Sphingobium sp.]
MTTFNPSMASSPLPVIIVGAGPVGLLLASELGLRDIPVTVIEARTSHLRHPKANTQSARSMEIYRRHGLSRGLRENGLPADRRTDVGYFTRLFGQELHRVPLDSPRDTEAKALAGDPEWPTPEPQYRVTQMLLEPRLLERARSFPTVEVRFGHSAVDMTEDGAGVSLTVENVKTGEREVLRAAYVVGADGGRSFVRRKLDIRYLGDDGLEMEFMGGRMLATYFRAPGFLASFPHADTWMHWTMQPGARGIFLVIDPARHEFLMHVQLGADEKADDTPFADRLAAVVGKSVEHEILSSAEWRAGLGLVAERYAQGRCLLAGDAVHLFTPTGGFGLNTGIEDAYNLGWKLAAVCQGISPAGLLETYNSERHPIGLRNTGFALNLASAAGSCPVTPNLEEQTPAGKAAREVAVEHLRKFAWREFNTPGVQLGARYDGSSIVFADEEPSPEDSPTLYIPSGKPGGRLPHTWLTDGASLFDRLGRDFTLLLINKADATTWADAAAAIGLDLSILDLSNEEGLAGLYGAPAVLVRPDQHIAWRGSVIGADPGAVLRKASGADLAKAGLAKDNQPAH